MKVFKYLLILILIVLIGGAVYFGTQDGSFDYAETKSMQAPPAVIFEQVNDLKQWEAWGPWKGMDPDIQFTYGDTTQGAGGWYGWKSDLMGEGKISTITSDQNKSLDQRISFVNGVAHNMYWSFEPQSDGTTEVTWGLKGEHSFLERVMLQFQPVDFETSMRTMYAEGLVGLDSVAVESMNRYEVVVEGIKDYGGGYYLYLTASARSANLSQKMAEHYGEIGNFMAQQGIASAGMPFTIYNEMDPATGIFNFSSAIPVRERITTPLESNVLCGFLEPTAAVKTVLKGNYNHLPKAYAEGQAYISKNNLIEDPGKKMFEIYANDPGLFPNPADWTTEIFMPVFKDLRSNHPIINND